MNKKARQSSLTKETHMQRIFIVVKGQECHAEAAAIKHDLELTVTGASTNGTEVYCETPMTDRAKVISWYAQDAGFGGAFDNGSCLWYTYRD